MHTYSLLDLKLTISNQHSIKEASNMPWDGFRLFLPFPSFSNKQPLDAMGAAASNRIYLRLISLAAMPYFSVLSVLW